MIKEDAVLCEPNSKNNFYAVLLEEILFNTSLSYKIMYEAIFGIFILPSMVSFFVYFHLFNNVVFILYYSTSSTLVTAKCVLNNITKNIMNRYMYDQNFFGW